MRAKAQTLRRLSPDRRSATLLAAFWQLELDATDDALIVLDQVTSLLLSHAAREHKDRRYAQLPDLDQAASRLRAAVLVLLDPPAGGIEELWSAIGRHVSRSDLERAAAAVQQLASQPDTADGQNAAFRGELLRRYQSLRRFLPIMLETIDFDAAPAGRPVLEAVESLRALQGRPGRVSASSVSLTIVTGRWRALVPANPELGADEVDRRAYSFCVLEALVAALDRRDVFVTRSGRFTDPRAQLLSGPARAAARPEICTGLSLEPDPQQALERLGAQLESAYRQTAERLPDNVALQIADLAGAGRPDLAKLEVLDEPEQLSTLRATTTAMLPTRVAFSEVLLEVCRWTGFTDAFTHLSEGLARAEDLHISICAVLLAEACNISLTEVANPGVPALSLNRLSWVSQNYVRAETIAAANERLLDVYRRIPLVGALGDGHIATVDRMRFRVPVRSIHTGPNSRYFARGRGVTWLNYLTDQFAGLHAIVVPGTLRDSLMILDGLLELASPGDGGPTTIITDQAAYSDQIFGLFWLLGYQFSPRPAGLPDQRFCRIDRHGDYGPLDGLARHRVNVDLLVEQWEDILRVAGSLSTGTVRASELLRVLQGGGRPTRLGRAIAELGRIAKTLHLLALDRQRAAATRDRRRAQPPREPALRRPGHLARQRRAAAPALSRRPRRPARRARLRAQRARALERPIRRRRDPAAARQRPPDHRRGPPAALAAAARAHQDARPLPLHPAPRPRPRPTPATTRARPGRLAYVPVPLLPGGRVRARRRLTSDPRPTFDSVCVCAAGTSLTDPLQIVSVHNVMVLNDKAYVNAGDLPSSSTGFLLAFTAAAAEAIYAEALSEFDLKPIHVGVLEILRSAGPDKQARLSDRLAVFKPVMVEIVNELEAMGLVERRSHPTDGRAFEVHLLRAGTLRLEMVDRANQRATEEVFGMLDEEDRIHLHATLLRIARSVQRHDRPDSAKGKRPR